MRIITGSARGFRLKTVKGLAVRPTADRVKESVFNILSARIPGAIVLDLFAGTGNLGLEALSRGADTAVFVDRSPASIAVLRDNALKTRLEGRAEIFLLDAEKAVNRFSAEGRQFNLIFCDPPYNRGLAPATVARIDGSGILAPEGTLVVEHFRQEALPTVLSRLSLARVQYYGDTAVSFYQLQGVEV